LDTDLRPYRHPRLSPDGQRLAISIDEAAGNNDVWVYDLTRGTASRLTFGSSWDERPIWTPTGEQIVFVSYSHEENGLFLRQADGTGQEERLTTNPGSNFRPEAFSPDGASLLFRVNSGGAGGLDFSIQSLAMTDDSTPQTLIDTDYYDGSSAVSPDGRWIAYVSGETGRDEIYVRPFPNIDDGKWQISTDGGDEPLWSSEGRELFYRTNDSIVAVSVDGDPTFSAGVPTTLFTGAFAGFGDQPSYDVSRDGQRFLMLKAVAQPIESLTTIAFVDNWFEELKRLVPPSE
jgi:serine/threonine-protein kinase